MNKSVDKTREAPLSEHLDRIKEASKNQSNYYDMIMEQPLDFSYPGGILAFRIKFALTRIFCLGTDAKLMAILNVPFLFFLIRMDIWVEKHLKLDFHWISDPLWTVYTTVVNYTICSVTYYWGLWFSYYLNHDNDYHTTIRKMTRNILVPLDMTGFYKAMIWGNDPITDYVRAFVKDANLYGEYKARQLRNGLKPQF